MLEKYLPRYISLPLAGAGYTLALVCLLIIFHYSAIGPIDLRPHGISLYVEDLRNPALLLFVGAAALLLFNERWARMAFGLFRSRGGSPGPADNGQ